MNNWQYQLNFIKSRLLEGKERNKQRVIERLKVYREILRHGEIDFDENQEAHNDLLNIFDLIQKRRGKLKISSPIYRTIFDETWVDNQLNEIIPQPKISNPVKNPGNEEERNSSSENTQSSTMSINPNNSGNNKSKGLRKRVIEKLSAIRNLLWDSGILLGTITSSIAYILGIHQHIVIFCIFVIPCVLLIVLRNYNQIISLLSKPKSLLIITLTILCLLLFRVILFDRIIPNIELNNINSIANESVETFKTEQINGLKKAIKSGKKLGNKINLNKLIYYPTMKPVYALHKTVNGIYKLNKLDGDRHPLNAVSFIQDGKIFAGGKGQKILMWNFSKDKVNYPYKTDDLGYGVTSLSFDKSTKVLAVGLKKGTVILFQVEQSSLRRLTEHNAHKNYEITNVEFSPDGKKLLTSAKDKKFKVWKISSDSKFGNELFQAKTSDIPPRFSPNGRIIAAVETKKINLWNSESGNYEGFIDTQGSDNTSISAICFSPDGKIIATVGDNSINLWDVSLRNEITKIKVNDFDLISLSFSPWEQSQLIAGVGDDGIVRIWKYSTDSNIDSKLKLKIKADTKKLSTLAFSPYGNYLITAGDSKKVNIIDLLRLNKDISIRRDAEEKIKNIHIGFVDNRFKLVLEEEQKVEIWDLLSESINSKNFDNVDIISISPKKDRLAIIKDGQGSFHYLSGNEQGYKFNTQGIQNITSISFNPKGSLLAIGTEDGIVKFESFRQNSNTPKGLGIVHQGRRITKLIFSPDGKYLVVQGINNQTKIFKFKNQQVEDWEKSLSNTNIVSFSPDSNYIVTGDSSGNIRIWKVNEKNNSIDELPEQPSETYPSKIKKIIFNSDKQNQYVAAFDAEGNAKLWKFDTKKGIIKPINWQGGKVAELQKITSIDFSPKGYPYGQLIATGEKEGKVRIWDMKGREIAEFKVPGNKVKSIKFSPYRQQKYSDNYIVAADENGKVVRWKISGLTDLINEGCNWLENYFSNHPNERNICTPQSKHT